MRDQKVPIRNLSVAMHDLSVVVCKLSVVIDELGSEVRYLEREVRALRLQSSRRAHEVRPYIDLVQHYQCPSVVTMVRPDRVSDQRVERLSEALAVTLYNLQR